MFSPRLALLVAPVAAVVLASLAGADAPPAPCKAGDAFLAAHAAQVEKAASMTLELLQEGYPDASFAETLPYKVDDADYLDDIVETYPLSKEATALLGEHGFVVTTGHSFPSFGAAFLDIFEHDLPVYVTTDAILQALHMSFDSMLMRVEETYLVPRLGELLEASHLHLPTLAKGAQGAVPEHLVDADVYFTVARTLLAGTPVATVFGAASAKQVDELLGLIKAKNLTTVSIWGAPRMIDFSQFVPRGHYTTSPMLTRYFLAMMWLGRTDLRILAQESEKPSLVVRELLAAVAIRQAVVGSGMEKTWAEMDGIIGLMVGEPDDLTLETFGAFLQDAGIDGLAAAQDPAKQAALLGALGASPVGVQQICSQVVYSNPMSSTVAPLPRSFLLMGQRFALDSMVFSNVVFDRIVVDGVKQERMLPSPLDVMFVLGNDHALTHLDAELEQWKYAGNLASMRFLADQYDEGFWQGTAYNLWLGALMALSGPFVGKEYPAPMTTEAYHDKLLMTQLASWAQLRHDTILYVKQSYTAYPVCEYPEGYVEPIPAFYEAIGTYATKAKAVFGAAALPEWLHKGIIGHLDELGTSSATLASIAAKELAKQELSGAEETFLEDTILKKSESNGCATITTYAGWYPRLFFGGTGQAVSPDPLVADVHTNPAGGQVLHVGVGNVDLMIMTADTCEGPMAYVGPVLSYYEVMTTGMERLTDEKWAATLAKDGPPPRPAWTASFLAP